MDYAFHLIGFLPRCISLLFHDTALDGERTRTPVVKPSYRVSREADNRDQASDTLCRYQGVA